MNNYIGISGLMVFMLGISVTANDGAPTFHLKNKAGHKIAIVVHAADAETPKQVSFEQVNDTPIHKRKTPEKIVKRGTHIPSQPILVLPKHSIAYYDLRGINALDIYYKRGKELMVVQYLFNKVNDKTTFYLKHCDPVAQGGWFKYGVLGCGEDLSSQAGEEDKATGQRTTTEGYDLGNNVRSMQVKADGEAGTRRKTKQGTFIEYPIINFDDALNNYEQLKN